MTLSRHTLPFAGLAILILLVSGCTKKAEGPPPRRIAGIVFQEDQFFRLVLFGMREAARQENVELLEANSSGKPDKEIQLVNTYIAQKVDAIVISPLSARASISALERAHAGGITVVTYNTTIDDTLPAAYIEKRLGGIAHIAILAFRSQAPEQSKQRTDGFTKEVTTLPGVRIVAEQDAWLAEQAVKKAGDILTANPEVNIIWAANEGGTVGAVMAVKNAGKIGKVAVFGTDTGEQLADFLLTDDGILQAVTGQRPFDIGSLAVHTALAAVHGGKVNKRVSLPGLLLSRESPDSVRAFRQQLHAMTR